MSSQLVDDRVHRVHIAGVDLSARISFREMFHDLVHGWLVVADSGGDGIDSLLASGGGRIGGRHGYESWEGVHNHELSSPVSIWHIG